MGAVFSIAAMQTRKQAKPPEAAALDAAIKRSGLTKAAIADHLGVHPSMVSQMASGKRPVPVEAAAQLATLVSVDPGEISQAYAELQRLGVAQTGAAMNPRDADIQRMRVEILALNMAVGWLAGLMVEHRQAEAKAGAATIRRKIPAALRESGLFRELLEMLEKP